MRYLVIFSLLLPSFAQAAIVSYFKYEDGRTNWQYVANFSSSILIILLSLVILGLFIARRRLFKAHRELHAIRDDLEVRVKERTATLNESNTKLLASNEALEQEIAQHILTTKRLMTSEAYITDILTSMPLMLVCLDKDGRITHWNRRTEEVSGISAERALGKSLWEAYPTATVSPDQIQQAIKNQDTVHIKQSLRSMSHFDITIYPLRENSDGGVVLLIDDISKETMAENMLIHNDKMSFMGEMASTMAHDINTPLQGILLDLRSFQRALRANADSDDAQQNAKRAERLDEIANQMSLKGDQVNTIINNLLAFARSRQEKKQMV
ncbi:PAS domain-containing protein, partial [Neptunomonas phycophila]